MTDETSSINFLLTFYQNKYSWTSSKVYEDIIMRSDNLKLSITNMKLVTKIQNCTIYREIIIITSPITGHKRFPSRFFFVKFLSDFELNSHPNKTSLRRSPYCLPIIRSITTNLQFTTTLFTFSFPLILLYISSHLLSSLSMLGLNCHCGFVHLIIFRICGVNDVS